MKYRAKPVVIEAIQVPRPENEDAWEAVCRFLELTVDDWVALETGFMIKTFYGLTRANVGDWIVLDVKGNVCLFKPDIFEAMYELN